MNPALPLLNITPENFKDWMRKWAKEYGERPDHLVDGWDEGEAEPLAAAAHPLARAMEYAPGTRQAVLDRRTTYRDGSDRRRYMARDLASCGVRVIPMSFVDPVAGTATRPDMRTPRHPSRPPVPREVLAIQRCVMDMIENPTRSAWGHALTIHYCTRGDLDEKAARMGDRLGRACPVRAYRVLVEQAKVYLLGRLGA